MSEFKLTHENYRKYASDISFKPASYEIAETLYKLGLYAKQTDNDIRFATKCWDSAKRKLQTVMESFGYKDWQNCEAAIYKTGQRVREIELYYAVLKELAFDDFESYIYYMEQNRDPIKRFYAPRRKTLKIIVDDLNTFEHSTTQKLYALSLPARVGKSTICIFFLSWVMLRHPDDNSAMGGHSGILAKGFYREILNLLTTEEYRFKELFDYAHEDRAKDKFPTAQSAENYTINIGLPSRFDSLTCRGIDGTWTGAINISRFGYLYVDDLVRDREHSLSPTRMENTYQEMLNKMFDRLNDGAKVLMVGTLWSVIDPIERMRLLYEDDPRYIFRRIPALDENDESNFQYSVNGFSSEYYREMREKLDEAEWMAKYMQAPFVREGILMPKESLNYFNGVLPEGDCKTVAVVDVAWGGGDSLSMPVAKVYANGDTYVFDWVFNKGVKEVTLPLVVGRIMQNEIRQCRFEGNVGGAMYSDYVDEELRKHHYKCSCTEKKAPNNMAKVEKIIAYSGDVKRKFYFLSPIKPTKEQLEEDKRLGIKRYVRDNEYQKAMDEMCTFVTVGKNVNDDAIDSIVQLEMFNEGDGMYQTAIMHGVL